MKRNLFPVLLASAMLAAMTLASCKSSNKPAVAETSRIGEIPEAAYYIVGIEKFNTPIDYSQAANWLDVPAAMVKDGVLDATAAADAPADSVLGGSPAEAFKPVDVFYIYPTVTGFRPETEVCDMTDTMMIAGAQMVRQIQTAVFASSLNCVLSVWLVRPDAWLSSRCSHINEV
jgi:hypothetical protein